MEDLLLVFGYILTGVFGSALAVSVVYGLWCFLPPAGTALREWARSRIPDAGAISPARSKWRAAQQEHRAAKARRRAAEENAETARLQALAALESDLAKARLAAERLVIQEGAHRRVKNMHPGPGPKNRKSGSPGPLVQFWRRWGYRAICAVAALAVVVGVCYGFAWAYRANQQPHTATVLVCEVQINDKGEANESVDLITTDGNFVLKAGVYGDVYYRNGKDAQAFFKVNEAYVLTHNGGWVDNPGVTKATVAAGGTAATTCK